MLLREWQCARCGAIVMENPVEGGMLEVRDLEQWEEILRWSQTRS